MFSLHKDISSLFLVNSDGTLNPNGVRFGSAEIYHISKYGSAALPARSLGNGSCTVLQSLIMSYFSFSKNKPIFCVTGLS